MSPTWVYRFFGADGDLLYVGMTWNYYKRFAQHAADKPWWPEIDRFELEWFPTREEAENAESEAIWQEHPRYNIRNPIVDCQSVGTRGRFMDLCHVGEALIALGLATDTYV